MLSPIRAFNDYFTVRPDVNRLAESSGVDWSSVDTIEHIVAVPKPQHAEVRLSTLAEIKWYNCNS